MQSISQKKPLALSIIFFIFSCAVFVFLFQSTNVIQERSGLAREKWQTENIKRNNAQFLSSFLKRVEEKRALFDLHFVRGSDIVPFLDSIENLAKSAGSQAEVTFVNVAKDNLSLSVGMETEGSFKSIYKLVTLLESSPYQLEFNSVDMKKLTQDEENGEKVPEWTALFEIKLLDFIN